MRVVAIRDFGKCTAGEVLDVPVEHGKRLIEVGLVRLDGSAEPKAPAPPDPDPAVEVLNPYPKRAKRGGGK